MRRDVRKRRPDAEKSGKAANCAKRNVSECAHCRPRQEGTPCEKSAREPCTQSRQKPNDGDLPCVQLTGPEQQRYEGDNKKSNKPEADPEKLSRRLNIDREHDEAVSLARLGRFRLLTVATGLDPSRHPVLNRAAVKTDPPLPQRHRRLGQQPAVDQLGEPPLQG